MAERLASVGLPVQWREAEGSPRPAGARDGRSRTHPDSFSAFFLASIDTAFNQCLQSHILMEAPSVNPNRREALILRILISQDRYGLDIRNEVGKLEGGRMPLGSLYTTLDRMVAKGLLRSRMGASSHVRGGNRRRYFSITAKGRRAFDGYQMAFVRAVGLAR